jgi:hypothetical protein
MRALTIKLEEAEKDLEQKESRLADTRREITQAESAYTDSASRE